MNASITELNAVKARLLLAEQRSSFFEAQNNDLRSMVEDRDRLIRSLQEKLQNLKSR